MNNEPKNKQAYNGEITVGVGSAVSEKIAIKDYVQTIHKDNRVISVSELVDDRGYILVVENPPSTGRSNQQQMWLSKESFIGIVTTSMMYLEMAGEDLINLAEQSVTGDTLSYKKSEGLKHFNSETE